ncbi:unnamed protein product [Mytilus coruscus]|uniref:CCHC-type domain-containing protein n=1 Tax=Mytilus coruscus TaxID=42192 RepID=A0A6J8E8D1_MYTCO|nr:unnamed protein product [Mytilus coruscus]
MKCSKYLDEGHTTNTCPNGWKCKTCGQLDHKQYECNEHSDGEYDEDDTYMTNMDDFGNKDVHNVIPGERSLFQESEVYSQRRIKPLVNTEDRSRSDSDTEPSHVILGTPERRSSGKDSSQQQNEKPKNIRSVDRKPGISKYLTTKPSHDKAIQQIAHQKPGHKTLKNHQLLQQRITSRNKR